MHKSKSPINLHLPWVIPARGVTDIVFREPILILPPVETNPCITNVLQFLNSCLASVC